MIVHMQTEPLFHFMYIKNDETTRSVQRMFSKHPLGGRLSHRCGLVYVSAEMSFAALKWQNNFIRGNTTASAAEE